MSEALIREFIHADRAAMAIGAGRGIGAPIVPI